MTWHRIMHPEETGTMKTFYALVDSEIMDGWNAAIITDPHGINKGGELQWAWGTRWNYDLA